MTLYVSAKKITGGYNVLHLKFSWSGKRISLILQKIEHKLKRQYSPFLLEGVQLLKLITNLLLQACSLSNSAASVRTFQRPEETLEESLVALGVNTEGYSFLGKTSSLGPLSRGKSLHVANSKFYVKGMYLT